MNVQEFKEKYPHLAHLEGNELWDAMALAVWKEQPPFEKQEGDDEIVKTIEIDGLTFNFTRGAVRQTEKMFEDYTQPTFVGFGYLVPHKTTNI